MLGREIRERDVAIGVIMTFALGLGILFLSLYHGYAEQAYSILFGTIVGISRSDVLVTAGLSLGITGGPGVGGAASALQLLRPRSWPKHAGSRSGSWEAFFWSWWQ